MPVLRQILGAVAKGELEGMRRRATAAVFTLVAVFLVSLAAVFGMLGLFLWLATRYEPWQAALIVVGALILGALLIWITGRYVAVSASRSRSRADVRIRGLLDEASLSMKTNETSLLSITTALAIGFAIGRRVSK